MQLTKINKRRLKLFLKPTKGKIASTVIIYALFTYWLTVFPFAAITFLGLIVMPLSPIVNFFLGAISFIPLFYILTCILSDYFKDHSPTYSLHFIGLFVALIVSVGLIYLIGFISFQAFKIPVEDSGELSETNYRIYYRKGRSWEDNLELWSMETNGADKQNLGIYSFGFCSPEDSFTAYENNDNETINLYNFNTKGNFKLKDSEPEAIRNQFEWSTSSEKVAVIEGGKYTDLTISVFDLTGEQIKTETIPQEEYENSTKSKKDFLFSHFSDFKDEAGFCKGFYEKDLEESKIRFERDEGRDLKIYYGDKYIAPSAKDDDMFVDGLWVKNILPDGNILLQGPKSRASFSHQIYIYIYSPEKDSLYRLGEGNDPHWHYK